MIPDTWKTGRVGLVMMSAIGDTVHVLPVVTALKRHAPRCHLSWILQPGPATLVRGHRDVDEIVLFEKAMGWRAYPALKRNLPPFDLVIDLQVYFKAGLVTALADAPVKLGFDRRRARDLNWLLTNTRIPPHADQHVQDQYFEFLAALGVDPEPVTWDLGPWPHEREAQREFFATFERPAAALVIGTSDPNREWVPERWAAVADALWETWGLQPVLVGGRSARELDTEREILSRTRHPVVSALGMPLREMVGLLDGSALVVSLNTAPLHIAVALDRPVISLHGAWNPKRTGPYRKFHDLMVDAYGEPGEDYPVSAVKKTGRMRLISIDRVLEKVQVWADKYRKA